MQQKHKENKHYFLKYIDIFGVGPKLYINQKQKYRSSWGGFLTISLCICVIIACWIYGKDMYYRQKPITLFTEVANSHPERYSIKKKNFNFAFGLQNSQRVNYIDESIYTLKLQQEIIKVVIDENGDSKKSFEFLDIKVRPCQKSDFEVDPEFFTSFYGYENLYCIDDYEQEDLHIEGDFSASYYGNISGKLYPCTNSTDTDTQIENKVVCQPQEVIDKELDENQYTMNFSDQILDPKNYESPFTSVGRNLYGLTSKNEFRQFLLHFKNVYIEDNTGIIFDHIQEQRGLQFSYESELYRSKPKEDGNFFQFVIRFEKVKETKVYRSYLNIAAVIAQVGGILKILMIIFSVLSAYVARQMFNLQIANDLFNFQTEKEYQRMDCNVQDTNKKPGSNNKIEENNNNKVQKQKKSNNSFQQKQQNNKQRQNCNQLKFKSYLHLLFPFCAKRQVKEDKKLFNYAVNKITQKLDIHYIMERLIDIEKIKLLLLDNEQHKLFDYMSKPVINHEITEKKKISRQKSLDFDLNQNDQIPNNNKFHNIMLLEEKSMFQKNKEALKAYYILNNKKKKDVLDTKILNLMDKQMQDVFQSKLEISQPFIFNQNQQEIQNYKKQQEQQDMQIQSNILTNRQLLQNPELQNNNNSSEDIEAKYQQNDKKEIIRQTSNNLDEYSSKQQQNYSSFSNLSERQQNQQYDVVQLNMEESLNQKSIFKSNNNINDNDNNNSKKNEINQTGLTFFDTKIIFPESSYRNNIKSQKLDNINLD